MSTPCRRVCLFYFEPAVCPEGREGASDKLERVLVFGKLMLESRLIPLNGP